MISPSIYGNRYRKYIIGHCYHKDKVFKVTVTLNTVMAAHNTGYVTGALALRRCRFASHVAA
ncbi:hypothetical protein ASA01S_005_00040 [Aeromonas salmonicida subsp. masoucida NBRC 13784]|nr:hypothetical protein ASA01S_005_00040 [Aeromonas salmonicida subsp. masoucida NBRC 13784]